MLITKGVGEYIVILLLEVIWKVCVLIINKMLQSVITLHDVLHRFIKRRRAGMEAMEENLYQKLAVMCREILFLFSLDVRKSYGYLYRGRCMEIIKWYVLGPNLKRLVQRYWYN